MNAANLNELQCLREIARRAGMAGTEAMDELEALRSLVALLNEGGASWNELEVLRFLATGSASSGGNATVPADAPIQPPQAFVDYFGQDNGNVGVIDFSLPNKGVTKCYLYVWGRVIEDYVNSAHDDATQGIGVDLSGNALIQDEITSLLQILTLMPLINADYSGSRTIDLSGGTSADPYDGAATPELWQVPPVNEDGVAFRAKVNIHGYPVTVDVMGETGLGNGTCDFRGSSMTTAEVNALLAFLVANHLTDYDPTLLLNGAGMGAPTGQGLTDKAALITAGWTVTTN